MTCPDSNPAESKPPITNRAASNADAHPVETAYQFCPRCGTRSESVGKVPFRCTDCEFANFFGPVAAVGGLVVDDVGRLLLVRRARDPGKGCWGLPGGFVDRNESVEQALAREVVEETALKVSSCRLILTHPNQYNYRGLVAPVIDLFYVCEVVDRDQITLARDELDHYEWVHPTQKHLDHMAFASNRVAIEHWLSMAK
ncbi:MAG: NUDIX domain-containing protein [Pirellulaceae bacterium]|nr:NUDIX domain-containing protein [Pirellulaceae bacterium]